MDFDELKSKIETTLNLDKPEFVQDTATNLNLGHLELGPTQKLVFSLSNFRNKNYIDIRTWFQDQSGEWKPTKKGIHFSFDKYADFSKILDHYQEIQKLQSPQS